MFLLVFPYAFVLLYATDTYMPSLDIDSLHLTRVIR